MWTSIELAFEIEKLASMESMGFEAQSPWVRQERLAKVESEARDEERLKLSKAEDVPGHGDQ